LAQVHKAKLKDGRIVAVKVQHPYVMKNSILDMKIMEVIKICGNSILFFPVSF
jgi:aarF domain-containing kinase